MKASFILVKYLLESSVHVTDCVMTMTVCTCPERQRALMSLVLTGAVPVCADGGIISTSPLPSASERLNDCGPTVITLSTATAGHMYSGTLYTHAHTSS